MSESVDPPPASVFVAEPEGFQQIAVEVIETSAAGVTVLADRDLPVGTSLGLALGVEPMRLVRRQRVADEPPGQAFLRDVVDDSAS